jgi:3-hydroxyisobutyrate dehydrogenase-like beta-hydroxyacid dehydrogenase
MKIAFLGLGNMGSAMARRLLTGGHEVTVWNRSAAAAEALAEDGAVVATSATEAVAGQEVVFSMLFDDAAHEAVLLGDAENAGVIAAMEKGALHIACSTISVGLSERLAAAHAERGQEYVAAPVFGRPNVAAEGKLWIVVAGSEAAVNVARPLLAFLSRGISVVGERPAQAHALKLAGNFLITMMIQGLSEAVIVGKVHGLEPELLLETVNSALFQSPFYAAYSKVMLNPPTPPGATVALGRKDLSLFLEAADEAKLAVAETISERFTEAIADGLGSSDWAAGMLQAAEKAAKN